LKGRRKHLKKIRILLGVGLILIISLAACERLPFELPWLTENTPTATLAPGETEAVTPTPEITTTEDTTPEPITSLTLWVPPEMDPSKETGAGQVFNSRLQLFSDLHENIEINVRVKAIGGVGGLLDSLTAANAAAPDALPDLIALSRSDLETAALKNLIFSLDGLTEIPDDSDWFGFTREMALLQGSTIGLPFAADCQVLVYRADLVDQFPANWSGIFETDLRLAFPAESDQSLFQMSLYQASGGSLQDNQRRPMLEVEPLTATFRLFQQGVEAEVINLESTQYQTSAQVWTAFREGQANLVVTWLSNYLKDAPSDAVLVPLLPMDGNNVSIGTGMSWALAAPDANRHPVATALAEFLVEPEFLAEWGAAAGYLPPRPSSLDNWQDQPIQSTLNQIALMTRLRPSNDIIASLGPIIREQTRQVLQGLVDPSQAAQLAVESLEE
jgi:ABC-type glycerol-3-phosphate transport system substrate-binding protein